MRSCPICGSKNINLFAGGQTGWYECKDCGYVGPLVIDKSADFFKVIEKRQSIRKYKKKEIEKEKIMKILETIRKAPSAGNLQAYEVVLTKDKERIKEIAKCCYQSFIGDAPLLLIFFADEEKSCKYYGERGRLYSLQDATIATTFAMLSCVALELSCCWIGAFDEECIKKITNAKLKPIAILTIGYPDEKPEKTERRRIGEFLHFEKF